MTIWLIILPFGAATYAMRASFLLRWRQARSSRWQRWLRFVPPAVLAALVLPELLAVGQPLAPDTLHQLLAAGLAAVVAWRFQNVLATVASGMVAFWGLLWLPDTALTLSLPLGLLLLASGFLLLLLVGSTLAWFRLRRQAAGAGLAATTHPAAVTVTPVEDRRLPAEAVSFPARKPAGTHLHCSWCWCPLPVWARYCGQCGLPQPAPALAVTQPLAAVTVRPEGSERCSLPIGAPEERTKYLPMLAGASGARSARSLDTARNGGTIHRQPG